MTERTWDFLRMGSRAVRDSWERTVLSARAAAALGGALTALAAGWPEAEAEAAAKPPPLCVVLTADKCVQYVERFNREDEELYREVEAIPNADSGRFLKEQIPLFECPDKEMERTYYFRWWTYRKHLKQTPDGFVVTEFLPNVPWAGKYNAIPCPAGLQIAEGRWLHDPRYMQDYLTYWLRKGGAPRDYSFWIATAAWENALASGDVDFASGLLPELTANYREWERTHLDANGLYWQTDDRDGMEVSIGGSGYRATINSYQYGDAMAIAEMARIKGDQSLAAEFAGKAAAIKKSVQEKLWDPEARFFKVAPRQPELRLARVREEHGYTPWYFNLPDAGYEEAWKQLTDPRGFAAPFGPTSAEQRDPDYRVAYEGHECQWNGPSWPFATSMTLTSLANLLNSYSQAVMTKSDYFNLLRTYTLSHRLPREDGTVVPWIDEDLDPQSGAWIAHRLLNERGQPPLLRGKDYNHSKYGDLIITGLVGLRPKLGSEVEVNPLAPEAWDYFCLDGIPYHGRALTILYDKAAERYGRGIGLRVLVDGVEVAAAPDLRRVRGRIDERGGEPAGNRK